MWDATDGQPLGLGFDTDGREIVTLGKDAKLLRWPAPATWREAICAKLSHDLSERKFESEGLDTTTSPVQCPAKA